MPPDRFELMIPIYLVVVGLSAVVLALLGLTGVLAPDVLRRGLKALSSRRYLRLMGTDLMFVGAVMFLRTSQPSANLMLAPQLGFWLGILTFIKGTFWLSAPGLVQRVVDFHLARNDLWHRFLGIVCLGAAVLYVIAVR